MNIVIVGASEAGLYLAALLSKQKHNVILIDQNGEKLQEQSWQMDVAIQEGSGTDWKLLNHILEAEPHLFIALTNKDEDNLVACSMAKNLGYPKTIARVRNTRFLDRSRLDFCRIFNVDYFIAPELQVAYDIYKQLVSPSSLAFENFANGEVQMRTLQIPPNWNYYHLPLSKLHLPKSIIVGLIYRAQLNEEPLLIFPHGNDHILPGDEVTFIGERKEMANIDLFLGLKTTKVKKVIVAGGSLVGLNLVKILQEHQIKVQLLDKNLKYTMELSEELPKCQVIQEEGADFDFLLTEKIDESDYFVMCTSSDERNVVGALLAKESGCKNTAVVLSNNRFASLTHHLGILHVFSPKIAVANCVISLATSKAITSLISLYENEAEILELTVSINSEITGIPLAELGARFPKDFLIAMIQNRGCLFIARGDSVICPGDTVIVICNPKYFHELEKIF